MTTNKRKEYSGVIVPMVTPFSGEGKIDFGAVEKLIRNFTANDICPLVLGTTGECASIHDEDKVALLRFLTSRFHDRTRIYVVISDNCLRKSLELARQYFDFGIDLNVALLPNYYPLNRTQIRKYFEDLAESIPGKLFLYNIPATTGISIPLDIINALSFHPKIVGLKDSEQDLPRLEQSVEMWKDREDFSHFVGWGAQCFYGLCRGSDGIVPSTGNFCPAIYRELYSASQGGERERGLQMLEITMEIASIYQNKRILSESLPALKVMLDVAGLCAKTVISPFTELPPEEEEQVRRSTAEMIEKYQLSWI